MSQLIGSYETKSEICQPVRRLIIRIKYFEHHYVIFPCSTGCGLLCLFSCDECMKGVFTATCALSMSGSVAVNILTD